MSFIGPRPALTYHPWPYEEYTEHQKHMFDVRPGITGWAQINGRKEVDYYDLCDLFVLPSYEESFGRVYVEAGARGKASIGCRVGGVPEVIEDGKSGLLVEPGDIDKLSESIKLLMTNGELREQMSLAIHDRVVNKFSFDAAKNAWKELLS